MGNFGDKLRREREKRKISLEQIAAQTKIGTRMLKALEDEKFDLLPGGIFNKGFVRAYAKAIGINEDEAVADFVAASGPDMATDPLPQIANQVETSGRRSNDEGGISWNVILALVLIVAVAYAGWTFYSHRKAQRESSVAPVQNTTSSTASAVEPAPAAPASSAPVATPTSTEAAPIAAPAAAPTAVAAPNSTKPAVSSVNLASLKSQTPEADPNAPVQIVIRTTGESWISTAVDGKTVLSETLPASAEKRFSASRRISMTVGNAGAVQITFNGNVVPSLGGDGKVRSVIFTPTGFQIQSSEDQ